MKLIDFRQNSCSVYGLNIVDLFAICLVPSLAWCQIKETAPPFGVSRQQPESAADAKQETAPSPRLLSRLQSPGRLRRIDECPPALGNTPVPSELDMKKFNQFHTSREDHGETLDLIVGRPRLILLKKQPKKTKVCDTKVATSATLQHIEELHIVLLGKRSGTTVLYLSFEDPNDPKKEVTRRYRLRVLPAHEAD